MSTRATIKFSDGDYDYYVYRHSDGYPENVERDIEEAIEKAKYRWSEPEVELLVTLFLAMKYDYKERRLPYYVITPDFHGDESYKYYCNWNSEKLKWDYGVLTL